MIIRDDGGDLRLLEHELGNEDCVRIAGPAPGEIAPMPTIPTNKTSGEKRHDFLAMSRFGSERPTPNARTSNAEFRVELWALSVERLAFSK